MSLRSLTLPPLLNTSDHDLIQDFFAPCLAQAFRYDRGVGAFSSGWLRLASQGVAAGVRLLCYNGADNAAVRAEWTQDRGGTRW
jgi:hypothetical protein